VLEFGLSEEDAVNQPKFHHQWLPDQIDVEREFPQQLVEALQAMGYKVNRRSAIGRTELIRIFYENGRKITAIADKRGDDAAAGY
jgi:gamma-glutamyltranspeptidase/glutathione hydrolase